MVGMLNGDGAPMDQQLLAGMTAFLVFRGPDAQTTWADGAVGLGHTLLRTTWEAEHERQPCSLDGFVWITADARIDDRATLVARLAACGRTATPDIPDVELILHAYHAWGERCVEHLLGDFAFALWDTQERRLFCARDHFGVKPFFYARRGDRLLFSNTLNCLRLHPDVSETLNELAIADFLLFEGNEDLSTTAFADISRLPPAHTLTWSDGKVEVRRFWSLPVDGDIRYRRGEEYVEHFQALLTEAVRDRLRTRRVGVLMSGGLDSTSVAAVATKLVPPGPEPLELHAFTTVYDSLIPDEERHWAGVAARGLGIPVHFQAGDGYALYEGWDRPEMHTPEPGHGLGKSVYYDLLRQVAAHARVVLTGFGADPALHGSATYALSLLSGGSWARLTADLWQSLSRGHLPRVGVRAHLRRWLKQGRPQPAMPVWVSPQFVRRLDLEGRWARFHAERPAPHPRRPEAWRYLVWPGWASHFEADDPGATGVAVEHRHPFFDVRVLAYLLAISPMPWCDDKIILRSAMAGLLPEPVRLRPKAPLAGDPVSAALGRESASWVDEFVATPDLAAFVARERIPRLSRAMPGEAVSMHLRPLSLNYWLRGRRNHERTSRAAGVRQPTHSGRLILAPAH
jgi:asparagine synthase (glutamine-hydrolysing)